MKAYAKVNLTLEVLARRQDGFHQIASILQCVDLSDDVIIEPATDLSIHCDAPIPDEENLALRAARLLQRVMGVTQGAHITLRKRIPMAGGMGGGSSDAATVLRGLARLWGLRLALPPLASLASDLGSDVPFFVYGGTALAEGRGELVSLLPDLPTTWMVLVTPPIVVPNKTGALYKLLDPSMFTTGEATRRLVRTIGRLEAPRPGDLFNVFERVADAAFPGLAECRQRFEEAGAGAVHLSGSGPTLFALVSGPDEGETVRKRCDSLGLSALLVKTVASSV